MRIDFSRSDFDNQLRNVLSKHASDLREVLNDSRVELKVQPFGSPDGGWIVFATNAFASPDVAYEIVCASDGEVLQVGCLEMLDTKPVLSGSRLRRFPLALPQFGTVLSVVENGPAKKFELEWIGDDGLRREVRIVGSGGEARVECGFDEGMKWSFGRERKTPERRCCWFENSKRNCTCSWPDLTSSPPS
jgi:hypothetical protein